MNSGIVKNDDGLEVHEYHHPTLRSVKTYEIVFEAFKANAKRMKDAPAAAVAIATADELGISVQHVVESCAVVHAANAARGQFGRNE
jgi:hypothetical protein